ncbi:hypothetical protein N7520_008869 [Penicillium odoratum]|uniref:uncharacterized protein n=1 Tax=Penicillium odoratum TaxID=1167516 RepID=UPI002546DF79|nr:uncharacterized protein N7520_008869 [Penicillium odoratum]KAJ5751952.1 hypothetical protein N7520_008869 [Penicillium odoratum]
MKEQGSIHGVRHESKPLNTLKSQHAESAEVVDRGKGRTLTNGVRSRIITRPQNHAACGDD